MYSSKKLKRPHFFGDLLYFNIQQNAAIYKYFTRMNI